MIVIACQFFSRHVTYLFDFYTREFKTQAWEVVSLLAQAVMAPTQGEDAFSILTFKNDLTNATDEFNRYDFMAAGKTSLYNYVCQ